MLSNKLVHELYNFLFAFSKYLQAQYVKEAILKIFSLTLKFYNLSCSLDTFRCGGCGLN